MAAAHKGATVEHRHRHHEVCGHGRGLCDGSYRWGGHVDCQCKARAMGTEVVAGGGRELEGKESVGFRGDMRT